MKIGLGVAWILLGLFSIQATAAEKPARVYRVGVMVEGGRDLVTPQIKGLIDGLEEMGYIEGKNLAVDLLHGDADDGLRAQVKAYIQRKTDVLVGTSGAETAIAKELTDSIPIVFMPGSEPIRSGFVKSMARPETNLTGLTFYTDFDDIGKQLETFRGVVPSLRQVLVLYDGRKENPTQSDGLAVLRKTATRLNIKLTERPNHSILEAERTVSAAPRTQAGIFPVCGSMFKALKGIASLAIAKKMPLFGCSASQVIEEDVLLTYAPDLYYIGYRGAAYVDRIFRGAKPQYLPVETPTKFELVINLRIAKALNITIPPEVLILADRVIK